MSTYILQAEKVTKKYGNFVALDSFNCEIPPGVTGLLGPNGAGKTTFIRTLLGIHGINGGKIQFVDWVLPKDIVKAKDQIGYQPEVPTSLHKISAIKYVTHMGKMAGLTRSASIQRAFDTLHYVGLEEARYREMNTFSQGMLQKVKLATALVHDPMLLILDEPTAGCDPDSRNQILSLIEDLGKNYDKNIIISTHLLPDIERTANYVVVMSQGQEVMQGDLKTILQSSGESVNLQIRVNGDLKDFSKHLKSGGYNVINVDRSAITCVVNKKQSQDLSPIFKMAKETGHNIRMISPMKQFLEDVFLEAVSNGGNNYD